MDDNLNNIIGLTFGAITSFLLSPIMDTPLSFVGELTAEVGMDWFFPALTAILTLFDIMELYENGSEILNRH